MPIDTIVDAIADAEDNEAFDGRNIWLFLDEQIDWSGKGCGFIYRNLNGAFRTRREALENAYGKMGFLGNGWKLEKDKDEYVSYIRNNTRIYVAKYDMEGPSIFDVNH